MLNSIFPESVLIYLVVGPEWYERFTDTNDNFFLFKKCIVLCIQMMCRFTEIKENFVGY